MNRYDTARGRFRDLVSHRGFMSSQFNNPVSTRMQCLKFQSRATIGTLEPKSARYLVSILNCRFARLKIRVGTTMRYIGAQVSSVTIFPISQGPMEKECPFPELPISGPIPLRCTRQQTVPINTPQQT